MRSLKWPLNVHSVLPQTQHHIGVFNAYVALPRTVLIRARAIKHIRGMINITVSEHTVHDSKAALRALGDDYLSFLVGDRKSPEVWMGLWTSDTSLSR